MSIVIKQREGAQRNALASQSKQTYSSGHLTPSSLGRSYTTPESSVSPGIAHKELGDSRDASPGSGDETDDLDMDGIDGHADVEAAKSSPYLDATGMRMEEDPAVAPATLAETYLPALFAQHGPCAIRHLTQYLAINNAKFGALGQGKQRRLIVKALELKKGILFEKVGWGRWNQIEDKAADAGLFTPESMPQTYNRNGSLLSASLKNSAPGSAHFRGPTLGTYPSLSSFSSHHEFMFSPSLSVAETSREDEDGDIDPLDLDLDDGDSETDEEDWKTLGAEALRARQSITSAVGSFKDSGSFVGSFGSGQRSSPYPIRRRSSAGVYQMNSPHLPASLYSNSPSFSRPSFPKTSSYLRSSPMSNARASSFTKARESRVQQASPTRPPTIVRKEPGSLDRSSQADAVEALVMLSGSHDERRLHS